MGLNQSQFSQPRMVDPGPVGDPNIYFHASESPHLSAYEPDPDLEGDISPAFHGGTVQAGLDRLKMRRVPTNRAHFHMFKTKPGSMGNSPDSPVSDNYANTAHGDPWEDEGDQPRYREGAFLESAPGAGLMDTHSLREESNAYGHELYDKHYDHGLYYTNEIEDKGSTSVSLPTLNSAQFLGSVPGDPRRAGEAPGVHFPSTGRQMELDVDTAPKLNWKAVP